MRAGEIAANVFVAAAIFLAGRNNIHTWWTGIVGCAIFGAVFFSARGHSASRAVTPDAVR